MDPSTLGASVDVVVDARLTQIRPAPGRLVLGEKMPVLLMEFDILESVAGTERSSLERLRVVLDQGPKRVGRGEPAYPISLFREGVPSGTRMLLFLNELSGDPDFEEVRSAFSGTVYGAPVQGIVVEDCGDIVGGRVELTATWSDHTTIDELKAAVASHS